MRSQKKNGFVGTEEEWLLSLQGEDGADGTVYSGYGCFDLDDDGNLYCTVTELAEGAACPYSLNDEGELILSVEEASTTNKTFTLGNVMGPQGATGAKGDKGDTGDAGEDGVSPALSSSKSGTVTTVYYTDASHLTPAVLATINDGAAGAKGDTGEAGAKGDKGDKGDAGSGISIASATVSASGWSSTSPYTNTVTCSRVTADNDFILAPSGSNGRAALSSWYNGMMAVTAQASGSFTLTAYSYKPTTDIAVDVIVLEEEDA